MENEDFQVRVFMDFPRHSQIYDMGRICLGIWVGLVDKNDMDAHDAFKLISYNYLPNFMLLS